MSTLIAAAADASEYAARFQTDGVLVVDPLVDADTVESLKRRTAEIAERSVAYPTEFLELEPGASVVELSTLRKINHCHFHDDIFAQHAAHPGILDVVEALIGPDIKVFNSQLFMKPPGGVENPLSLIHI